MDAYENILTLRSIRHFLAAPLPEEALHRILEAGRWTGSAKNTQPWHFIVVRQPATLARLAECGSYASHLRGAPAAVVIAVTGRWSAGFDTGRAAQNMMLAAWAAGIGSCIATLHAEDCARAVLGAPAEWQVQTAISFGYPDPGGPDTIEGLPRAQVLASLGRKPLADIVHWEQW